MQMRTMSGDPIILTSTLNNFHGAQKKSVWSRERFITKAKPRRTGDSCYKDPNFPIGLSDKGFKDNIRREGPRMHAQLVDLLWIGW